MGFLNFERFKNRCIAYAENLGISGDVEISNDGSRYTAVFSNGLIIVGNAICPSIRVYSKSKKLLSRIS